MHCFLRVNVCTWQTIDSRYLHRNKLLLCVTEKVVQVKTVHVQLDLRVMVGVTVRVAISAIWPGCFQCR